MTVAPTHQALDSLRRTLLDGMRASKAALYQNMRANNQQIDPDPQMAYRALKVRVESVELVNTGYQHQDIKAHYHYAESHVYYRYYTHISRLVDEMENTLKQFH